MRYQIDECRTTRGVFKEVCWEIEGGDHNSYPKLGEIMEAAAKEFPGITIDDLVIIPDGRDAETVVLKEAIHIY